MAVTYPPQYRITIKCNDGVVIDNSEVTTGTWEEILTRGRTLARRTSYVPDGRPRKVYLLIERFSFATCRWVKIYDVADKISETFHHSQLAPAH